MALPQFFDRDVEPEPLCRNCEYFDGGGLTLEGNPMKEHGDCHNRMSPHFTTTADQGCDHFWPCSTRWPDCDHD